MMKNILMVIARAFAALAKQDLIPQAKYQHPARLLKEALRRYQVDVIFDVGANHGQFAQEMLQSGFTGQIISFEPTTDTFSDLERRAASYGNWHCLKMGLSDVPEKLQITRHGDDSLNSFLEVSELARSRYRGLDHSKEVVALRRLDDVVDELFAAGKLRPGYRAFLKLDTQGFDLKALAGVGSVIDDIFIIQTEASVNAIYKEMPTYQDTLNALHKLNFRPAGFVTVSRDKKSLQFVEFDIIALKSPHE